jgi:glycosyltransferase involved in cell wall biosynthesis
VTDVAMLCHGTEGYGIRRVVLDLLQRMPDVHLVVQETGRLAEDARAGGARVELLHPAARVDPFRVGIRRLYAQVPALLANARQLASWCVANRVRVVHTHLLPLHLISGLAARRSRGRLHSVWQCHVIPRRGTLGRITRAMHCVGGLGLADRIIAVSEAAAEPYRTRLGHNVRVVTNGIGQPVLVNAGTVAQLRRTFSSRWARTLCWAGRLVPSKGLHVAVEALGRLARRDVGLVVLGDTSDPACCEAGYVETLNRLIAHHGLGDQVIFLGCVDDTHNYFAATDVVVHTRTDEEPCSMVIIEALSVGSAVVATRTGGTPELIRDGETGVLVPPKDPAALDAALRRLLAQHSTRLALGARARVDAIARFRIDRVIEEIRCVYRQAGALGPDHERSKVLIAADG